MFDLLKSIFSNTLLIAAESALPLLLGSFFAGLIRSFLDPERMKKLVAEPGLKSVLRASLLGVPLPLCSCSVLPVAMQLRRSGASRGATSSFLISTPQTGVDSFMLTLGLMNPFFAVARVISAFVTGTVAGIGQNLLDRRVPEPIGDLDKIEAKGCGCSSEGGTGVPPVISSQPEVPPVKSGCCSEELVVTAASCCGDSHQSTEVEAPRKSCCASAPPQPKKASCCCESEGGTGDSPVISQGGETPPAKSGCCSEEPRQAAATRTCCGSETNEGTASSCCGGSSAPVPAGGFLQRLISGQHYAYFDLLPKMAHYYLIGFLATGIVMTFLPQGVLENFLGGGLVGMLAVCVIGMVIYICASSTTPLVAVLVAKGMSPGTALVLLLAGPATSLASMAAVRGMLGTKGLVVYLLSIMVCAVAMGLGLDFFYTMTAFKVELAVSDAHEHLHLGPLQYFLAAVLLFYLGYWVLRRYTPLMRRAPA